MCASITAQYPTNTASAATIEARRLRYRCQLASIVKNIYGKRWILRSSNNDTSNESTLSWYGNTHNIAQYATVTASSKWAHASIATVTIESNWS